MHPLLLQGAFQNYPIIRSSEPPLDPIHQIVAYSCFTVIVIFILWILILAVRPKPALKHWSHHFDGMQLSSKEVFNKIVEEVRRRQLPDVSMGYSKFFEAGWLSPRREYLVVDYKIYYLHVCCISFGTGCYMSWWLGQQDDGLIAGIKVLNDIFGKNPKYPSYYQLDTASLFQSCIHDAILKVIDEMTEQKGLRKLTELERQPVSRASRQPF